MSEYVTTIIFLAVSIAVLAIILVMKSRVWGKSLSLTEKAEYLSKRRARMLPFLAVIFLSQQAAYFSSSSSAAIREVDRVKIAAWLVLSIVLVAALATKGFWLQSKAVRDLIDDENTRANRLDGMRWGFLASMAAGVGVYLLTMYEPVTGREAVHLVMTIGIAAALVRWGVLERRAYKDA